MRQSRAPDGDSQSVYSRAPLKFHVFRVRTEAGCEGSSVWLRTYGLGLKLLSLAACPASSVVDSMSFGVGVCLATNTAISHLRTVRRGAVRYRRSADGPRIATHGARRLFLNKSGGLSVHASKTDVQSCGHSDMHQNPGNRARRCARSTRAHEICDVSSLVCV